MSGFFFFLNSGADIQHLARCTQQFIKARRNMFFFKETVMAGKEEADGKVRCKPGGKHRWRMSHVVCMEWQAETRPESRRCHSQASL